MPAVKPSPAQARLLRAVRDAPASYLRVWYSGIKLISGDTVHGGVRRWDEGTSVKSSRQTVMACMRLGWLERQDFSSLYGRGDNFANPSFYAISDAGEKAIAGLSEEAFVSKPRPYVSVDGEAARVIRALAARHPRERGWIFLPEAPAGDRGSRVDAWAINCYASQKYRRIGYEVKVSRSDFHAELARADKTARSAAYCNQFFFACPEGVLKPSDVPDPYGLVVVKAHEKTRMIKRAQQTQQPPGWNWVGYLLRHIVAMEDEGGTG